MAKKTDEDEIQDLLDELDENKDEKKPAKKGKVSNVVTGVIEVTKLKFNDNNREVKKEPLTVLQNSIKKFGLLVPIITGKDGEVLDGERRARACINLGMKEIPFVTKTTGFDETSIVANYVRENLSEDEAHLILKRMKESGLTQEKIAEKIGLTQARVSQILNKTKKKKTKKEKTTVKRINLPENVKLAVKKQVVEITFVLDDEMLKAPQKNITGLLKEIKDLDGIVKKERK